MVIKAQDKHAECCLKWNVYDISVDYEFKMICMQKMNIISKIKTIALKNCEVGNERCFITLMYKALKSFSFSAAHWELTTLSSTP